VGILAAVLSGVIYPGPSDTASRDVSRTVVVKRSPRPYRVHLPLGYERGRAYPVVLVFHGGGSDADTMVSFSGISDKADRAGFIAVYPSGSGRLPSALTWNAGNCCGYALDHNVDDVAFTRRLLEDLAASYRIDARRIFATGMSNGAMLAHRVGAELSDTIAAIAPVAGPLGFESIAPARPVPVMHFHGTADAYAPYAGGQGSRSLTRTEFHSVSHTIERWVGVNGCPQKPTTTREPDHAADGMRVVRTSYADCRDRAEVVLFTIEGGGHTWPGQLSERRGRLVLGPTTRDISANDLMWTFFEAHPRS
jgi:polyhydroxybutyrate depolymerase